MRRRARGGEKQRTDYKPAFGHEDTSTSITRKFRSLSLGDAQEWKDHCMEFVVLRPPVSWSTHSRVRLMPADQNPIVAATSSLDTDMTMSAQRGINSIVICGLLFISISATRFMAAGSRVSSSTRSDPEACTLLTAADASKALEVSSVTSQRMVASSPTGCVWSNDPAAGDTSRRVLLVTHTPRAFQIAKHPAIATIKIEPVTGIGDDAFYQLYPAKSRVPLLIWVIKGNIAISVQVQTGRHPSAFTDEQEKSKTAVLAKAALAKL